MGMGRSLFLAVAGATSLTIACVTPWQDSANLDALPSPHADFSSASGAGAAATSGQAWSRAPGLPDGEEAVPPAEVATLAPRTALGAPQSGLVLPTDRPLIAQQLQRELARVGCFDGEPSGTWTPAARKAMSAFMDRVNATLPTEEPDYILLSLVQAARGKVCDVICPAGQGLAEGGRCVPNAILAAKKTPQVVRAAPQRAEPASASPGGSATHTRAGAPPDEGRMGLSGPTAAKAPAVADALPGTAAAQPAPAPAGIATPGAPRPANAKRAAAQPLPFGMAILKQFGF